MIVWVIGLSGSGKSTVGRVVYEKWKLVDPATVLIDGDEIREIFKHDRGADAYTVEGRRVNADRISQLCAWLDRQQINAVCCILSIFGDGQDWNRKTYSKYLEVYLEAPEDELVERRHLYREARQGRLTNVVGVDIPFTPPHAPDMSFDSGTQGPGVEAIAERILAHVLEEK
ncbi:adenylylsulfate kinase [Ectothiorhodosinus mongolicus]|uniref:Adenylylsulfate kinase n=1 Tax=Ectothiorhodosinus mongolicus TaxID=233100 RepID=A0A1R3VTX7_9GAMM|nr:adenylyl-sulfate kinase [Ectothiorhodosinus mongolicus]ULX56794.1 adenylyl-sulfate kinase [Ectothiorhodosinus mongolicus]SIT68346.1 adenylylsulfate kinase [Ectothiorhodosinus mongolicus]